MLLLETPRPVIPQLSAAILEARIAVLLAIGDGHLIVNSIITSEIKLSQAGYRRNDCPWLAVRDEVRSRA
jgi:hypothetical protein